MGRNDRNSKHIGVYLSRYWILILGLISFLISFSYPHIALWFGLLIILLCVGVFSRLTRSLACKLLHIDPDGIWNKFWCPVTYGVISISLIAFAVSRFEKIAQIKEKQAQAEDKRLTKIANTKVKNIVYDAKVFWSNGKTNEALKKLEAAEDLPHATNLDPVQEFKREQANNKVESIIETALPLIRSNQYLLADRTLEKALSIPHATELALAKAMKRQINLIQNPEKIEAELINLPDNEYAPLKFQKEIPANLRSGCQPLDSRVSNLVVSVLDEVTATRNEKKREKEKQKRIKEVAAKFVNSGVGREIPTVDCGILGIAETQAEATDNEYWVAYLEKVDVSFVVRKSSDKVIFVNYGKNAAKDYLKRKKQQRKERIEEQFSAWNGSHHGLSKLIKRNMNDPGSYKHVETVYWDMGDHLVVRTTFRGKNAFGGIVKNWIKAKVDLDGNILEIIEQGP